MVSTELISLDLTDDERHMLRFGLFDWGGPNRCTQKLAQALGFAGLDDLDLAGQRIVGEIDAGRPLEVRDWTRAMFSAEVMFASSVIGGGDEWCAVHGGSDGHWIGVLRALQRKVPISREFLDR